MKFPQNILISLPHASYQLPQELKERLAPDMRNNDYRLIKNFSDFGTISLISTTFPKSQLVVAEYSRAIGDQNRADDAEDSFRETDFNGNLLWIKPLTQVIKEASLEQSYDFFHDTLQKKIDTGKFDLLLDVHDTGNRMLAPLTKDDVDRVPRFPDICISNFEGESCPDELLAKFSELLAKHCECEVKCNEPFKGGFITQQYGEQLFTIQVEFGRHLYMDERRQAVEPHLAKKLSDGFSKAIVEIAEFL